MRIKVTDLSSELKNIIRAQMKQMLIKELGYCPLASDEDKIRECVTAETCSTLKDVITKYYEQELSITVECAISEHEFVMIYLNRV